MTRSSRVAVIGAGNVGATAAYALMLRGLFSEIVLIDSNPGLATAQAADIADANALGRPARIWAGSYTDAGGAGIAVITAGAVTHGNESRLGVAARSAEIVASCSEQLAAAGFTGIILVAANPVDVMTQVAAAHSGLAAGRVIGTGTLLDSCRLRQALADRFDVATMAVEGLVLGEHGDTSVTAFSTIRIGGLPLDHWLPASNGSDRTALAVQVRQEGYDIVSGKGFTSFGIATAIVRICEAIQRDENAVLPVSCRLTGEFGIDDLYLSLPCILGRGGIKRILPPALDPAEIEALRHSADTLRAALARLPADSATAR
ncbi:L-lactate dehydrogenase [Polymorphobacter fuscus]|uniref:L-lactate dehydrogenase n=1 Tax=Sandarakinorhabdus fusca TaxID=1439888 RepID=A0A7C9GXI5_9SPHN|nr:L-lactate dehydrogenase [Polymorphobacter fuscus]KAB7643706.1 L-lactate dehydrogenase [Polymorphobacter fuscus]MQT18649.1 L-lactate dehydrogenase [Polymorphobacter fuscus]NJC08135.1 L-lactate dehydrogenase [Polymorphobacter fuscus]